ncbi:MAG TPA: TIR domain-containing protein [Chthoniobacterales bacterium]|nr:TIR domain-containing protein [Chthoniobacterales bacterium]
MKERFENDYQTLIDALKRQEFVAADSKIAAAFASCGQILEFKKGDEIVTQGGEDNDIYLLLAGSVAIVINRSQRATRHAGQYVGEMAAIEPAQKRSASVVAQDILVVLKVSSADFISIGRTHPEIWLPMVRELSRRLYQRNRDIPPPNDYPKLFIISSVEALDVAHEIQAQMEHDALSTVWTDGVFFAGGYPLEILEKAVNESDFAVAVAQPDDIVETRGARVPTLRDNVLFELGLFLGRLTRYRAILVHPRTSGLKLPTDLQGLTLASYQEGPADELSARLGPACHQIRKIVKSLGVRRVHDLKV